MLDSYNREISYLRISVTDRCNLRCIYCIPEEMIPFEKNSDCLSYEEIKNIANEAASIGIKKIRLTGGEPLVRKGIIHLVTQLVEIKGIEIVSMTTNGHYLDIYAEDLKKAGLSSLNISLDTLDQDKYRELTRGGDIRQVLKGIEAAVSVGFPIKINMVISESTSSHEISAMEFFCNKNSLILQKIKEYALDKNKEDDVKYNRPPSCSTCNRIRLLSNGTIKPCLHSDQEIFVDPYNINGSLVQAIENKPRCGNSCSSRNMVEIGG